MRSDPGYMNALHNATFKHPSICPAPLAAWMPTLPQMMSWVYVSVETIPGQLMMTKQSRDCLLLGLGWSTSHDTIGRFRLLIDGLKGTNFHTAVFANRLRILRHENTTQKVACRHAIRDKKMCWLQTWESQDFIFKKLFYLLYFTSFKKLNFTKHNLHKTQHIHTPHLKWVT